MELRHLRYFVAVAEELSFSRAAIRLSIAQPPLSQQIRDLEKELGAALFVRAHRRVTLTVAGQVFLEDARTILADAERAKLRAMHAAHGELGRLTIGYTSLIHCPLFPDILRRYRDRYSGVELVLRDLVTIDQMRSLHTNTLDVSFATHASALIDAQQEERLAQMCLLREPLRAALPAGHRLSAGGPVPLRALADESWIWFARQYDPTTYEHMMRLFEGAGFQPTVTQEVSQGQIFLDLVAAGLGVSLVPRSATMTAVPGITFVDLREPAPMTEFNIVWRREDTSPLVHAFLGVVQEIAGSGAETG